MTFQLFQNVAADVMFYLFIFFSFFTENNKKKNI